MDEWHECMICGKTAREHHHVFFGGQFRHLSEKYKLKMWLCMGCHDLIHEDYVLCHKWQVRYQRAFIKKYGEKLWWDVFGESWEGRE